MPVVERFLQYVTFNTTSNPKVEHQPTSDGQLLLAEKLGRELRALGVENACVSANGYVYASIPATPGFEDAPALGFIAHLDTSPDALGEGVQPMLHEHYNGEDVVLPSGRVISVETFPLLKQYTGQTLITSRGNTLLGADDKAGIAEIIAACAQVLRDKVPHGKLCVAFTPDEEIGRGTEAFDLAAFGADFAYTVDGGMVNIVDNETFNAATATVFFTGVSVHPGDAKDIMVNAVGLAAKLDRLLPADERPENTSGRQGYYFLSDIQGSAASAKSVYNLRDFDKASFEKRKVAVYEAVEEINRLHGKGSALVKIEDSYYNMGQVIAQNTHLVENAVKAVRAVGLEPKLNAVRGGTDGAVLSYKGLPCPNLGTGGLYFHGPNECISVQAMHQAVEVIMTIIGIYSKTCRSDFGVE